MLCKKPYVQNNAAYGCGQCMPCRLNRRRLWTNRICLEALSHESASFVTLTYNKENLPAGETLVPKHMQDFLKRVRKHMPVRFFGVGEYGDQSWRPHYHLALFGLGIESAEVVKKCWQFGYTMTGTLTLHSAQYIAGYVTKKLTTPNDVRLKGRQPEFARMSLRPGIGALSVPSLVETVATKSVYDCVIAVTGDIPTSVRTGGKILPLGRYLRRKIREGMEWTEVSAQPETLAARDAEMQALWVDYVADKKAKGEVPLSIKHMLLEQNAQKVRNMETKAKIFASKGKKL